jgi:hypothetical protein
LRSNKGADRTITREALKNYSTQHAERESNELVDVYQVESLENLKHLKIIEARRTKRKDLNDVYGGK